MQNGPLGHKSIIEASLRLESPLMCFFVIVSRIDLSNHPREKFFKWLVIVKVAMIAIFSKKTKFKYISLVADLFMDWTDYWKFIFFFMSPIC